MPLHDLVPGYSPEHATLVDDLVAEWKNPNSDKYSEPSIFVERDRPSGKVIHVYVVWSKWAQLDRVERSEIIMDAAEKVLPGGEVQEITIAMGLTSIEETRRLGLKV